MLSGEREINDLPYYTKPEPHRVSRIHFIWEASAALVAACAPKVPSLPEPTHNPSIDTKGIQQKYVGEILEIEDGFRGKKLVIGDPHLRRHTELVAGMYSEYYKTARTPDQLAGSVLLMPTTEDFITYLKQVGSLIKGFTEGDSRKLVGKYIKSSTAVVNLDREVFNPTYIQRGVERRVLPGAWNALRQLRVVATHEWGHETEENPDDPILKLLDPQNRYPQKRFDGFRIEGFADIAEGVYLSDLRLATETRLRYLELDEAVVELISARPNTELFPHDKAFYSSYPDYHGDPDGVSDMGKRLNLIKGSAKVNDRTLYSRHEHSQVRQLFYLLLKRSGLMPYPEDERVHAHIQALINTIIYGDPKNMQKYVDGALKHTPD